MAKSVSGNGKVLNDKIKNTNHSTSESIRDASYSMTVTKGGKLLTPI